MSRSYRFPDPWYAHFPARLERSLAESLDRPEGDDAVFHLRSWRDAWHTPPVSPIRRSALAAELRRRGWPARRARVAALCVGQRREDLDKEMCRFATRAARRRERTLIAAGRAESLGWRRDEPRRIW